MVETKPAERPLSPHLQIYRWPVTMTVSILHRITGGALYFGTLLVLWWLLAAAISDSAFDMARTVFGHWFGELVLFGYSWALIHHMLGGIRHLIWDTGRGLDLRSANMLSWINIVGAIALTALLWAVILGSRP
jgi:succinate dehydrogenase / fumarate reductase, cytochrome b subunit